MYAPFCDVIGCLATADRFYSDGYSPVERLCNPHWDELLKTSRARAMGFVMVNPDRLKPEPEETEAPHPPAPLTPHY